MAYLYPKSLDPNLLIDLTRHHGRDIFKYVLGVYRLIFFGIHCRFGCIRVFSINRIDIDLLIDRVSCQ